jgi:hypothetical protein
MTFVFLPSLNNMIREWEMVAATVSAPIECGLSIQELDE